MNCPNGHRGGMFCCEDNVNQIMARLHERFKNWKAEVPSIPVTLSQWKAHQKILDTQYTGEGVGG